MVLMSILLMFLIIVFDNQSPTFTGYAPSSPSDLLVARAPKESLGNPPRGAAT